MKERSGSLLVVDDNEVNRDLLSRRLQRAGYRVQTAADGSGALEAAVRGDVDLVLLDVNMPGMSGLEVLTEIRKTRTPLQLPVIMATGRTESCDIVEALELGANDYVTKPIDFPVAVARIATHLSLKWTEAALRESEQRYALAARGANDGLWDWDVVGNRTFFSPRWKSALGYEDHEIADRLEEWLDRTHPDDRNGLRLKLQEHLEGRSEHFECEHRVISRDGNYRWMVSRGVAVRDQSGRATRMAGSQRDVTLERVTDPLTGLPNRLLFEDRLGCLVERARRQENYMFGVIALELNGFRDVTDSLGRENGDRLLVAAATRLASCLRSADTLARFGGSHTVARTGSEEFSVLLDDIGNESNASRVAERLLEELSLPFRVDGQEVFLHPCLGVALNGTSNRGSAEIMQDAHTAMNRATASGTSRYEVFDPAMRNKALVRLQLEAELRRALERRELETFYQMIYGIDTGRIAGCEALIRWRHPARGLVQPGEFVPLAEETGLILEIDHLAMRIASGHLLSWSQRHAAAATWVMSVNLSARQFVTSDLVERIVRCLDETGLSPERLKLEVTESAIMQDLGAARCLLLRLKEAGIKIAIDDFGTGHSSLSYVHRLPLDTLKIDRSFMKSAHENSESAKIVSTVVSLAHSLGLDVVAEGVESREQMEFLGRLDCEYAQGYLLSRPMSSAAVESLLLKIEREGPAGAVPAGIAVSDGSRSRQ